MAYVVIIYLKRSAYPTTLLKTLTRGSYYTPPCEYVPKIPIDIHGTQTPDNVILGLLKSSFERAKRSAATKDMYGFDEVKLVITLLQLLQ
jgi:hypothetical protein